MALAFSSANTALTRTAALPTTYNPLTITCWVRIESSLSGVAYPAAFELYASGASTISLATNGTNNYNPTIAESRNSVNYAGSASTYTASIGEWVYCAVVYDGTNIVIHAGPNGDIYTINSAAASTTGSLQTLTNFSLGYSPLALLNYWRGSVAGVKMFNRVLSNEEIRRESRYYLPVRGDGCFGCYPLLNRVNGHIDYSGQGQHLAWGSTLAAESDGPSWVKWQAADSDVSFLIPTVWASAPQSYTLTAAAGSVPASGQAASLEVGRKLVAAQYSLAVSGNAAALNRGRLLSAASASVAVSGNATALRAARSMPATAANVATGGQSAVLRRSLKVSSAQGSVAITGFSANLLRGARLPVSAYALQVTGQTVGLTRARFLPATSASVAVSGQSAAFKRALRVAGSVASVPITGLAVSLSTSSNKSIAATTANIGITGNAAGIRATRYLTATTGSVSVVGVSDNLLTSRRLVSAFGSVGVAGANATLRRGLLLGATAGSFSVSGQAASLTASRRLQAAAGTAPIVGQAATLRYSGAQVFKLHYAMNCNA